MSWRLALLNRHLRAFEKPVLAKYPPERLRRAFEFKARLYFHAPFGSRFRRDELGGVPVQWATGKGAGGDCAILYLHGGGYVFGSSNTHRAMLARLSQMTGLPACLPDYRLAPENPFPAQIEDALACYTALVENHEVVIGGDSAGGGLALALLHEILHRDLPRPRGTFVFSPLADFTFSGASVRDNAESDCVLTSARAPELCEMLLHGNDPTDPRASPLFGRFETAPPVWIVAGDTEFLRDDAIRMAERLREQHVACDLTVEHDFPHVWPIFHNVLPEARATLEQLAVWIGELPAGRVNPPVT